MSTAARMLPLCAATVLLSNTPVANGAPVELDSPQWHAIVVRPVDLWVGDKGTRDDTLAVVASRKANYQMYVRGRCCLRGGPLIFQGPSDDPIVHGVRDELQRNGFELGLTQKYMFTVEGAQYMETEKYQAFAEAQAASYRGLIRAEGDPDTLESRIRGRKVAGAVLGVAMIGVTQAKFGTDIASKMAGSTIPGDIYQFPIGMASSLAPAVLPPLPPGPYRTISVRRLPFKFGMNGQVLVGLKEGSTDDDEAEVLIKAIAIALGVGATPESIEKARAEDFAYRKSVWDACVSEGRCKPDEAAAAKQP
jgi:hypothetical protein